MPLLIARLSQAEAPFLCGGTQELPSSDLGALSEWVKVLKEKVLRGMRTRRAESIRPNVWSPARRWI